MRALRGALPGALAIGGNAKLPSLGGLHGVTSLGADCDNNSLIIWGTGALRDLAGLRGVEGALPGALRVGENRALRSLQVAPGRFCPAIPGDADGLRQVTCAGRWARLAGRWG